MVGEGIRHFRKLRKISQSNLAEKVGTAQTYLSQIENDLSHPSVKLLKVIAEELEVNVFLLFWYGMKREYVSEERRKKYDMLKHSVNDILNEIFVD